MIVGGKRYTKIARIYRSKPKERGILNITVGPKRRMMKILCKRLKSTPMTFQVDAVMFAQKHKGRVLIADDMGLGKTFESIAWASLRPSAKPICVICPASVKFKWQKEWKQHAGMDSYVCAGAIGKTLEQRIAAARKRKHKTKSAKKRAIRRARVAYRKAQVKESKILKEVYKAKVLIINYDILAAWLPTLLTLGIKLLIIDECQYVKNRSRARTRACRKLASRPPHIIGLSGTPISGHPAEFFPILQMIRPKEFPSFWKYAYSYCDPRKNPFSGGWDFSGASHLEDLHERLKTIMIRRKKHEVLKDLPRKTRIIIPIEIANRAEYDEAEADFLDYLRRTKGAAAHARAARAEVIVRMNGLRQLAGVGKIPFAKKWITDWLTGTDRKIFVTGIHKPVLAGMKQAFPQSYLIDGSTSNKPGRNNSPSKREKIVEDFTNKDDKRILFGQLKSTGVGIDLQYACSDVVFLEFGWNPDDHDQAEDRALRIGQDRHVWCYYLVGQDTIESRIMEINEVKDGTKSQILDGTSGGSGLKKLLGDYRARARRSR